MLMHLSVLGFAEERPLGTLCAPIRLQNSSNNDPRSACAGCHFRVSLSYAECARRRPMASAASGIRLGRLGRGQQVGPRFLGHPRRSEVVTSCIFVVCSIGYVAGLDAGFLGISPREAEQMTRNSTCSWRWAAKDSKTLESRVLQCSAAGAPSW